MPRITPAHPDAWAVVVDGSSGIGFAHAEILASRGFNIAVVARDQSRMDKAVARLARDHAASESFVLALSEGLHHELAPHGVTVTSLLPGPTQTPGLERMIGAGKPPAGTMTSAAVAREGIAALDAGRSLRIAGAHNRALLGALPRRARSRLMGRLIGELFASHQPA